MLKHWNLYEKREKGKKSEVDKEDCRVIDIGDIKNISSQEEWQKKIRKPLYLFKL